MGAKKKMGVKKEDSMNGIERAQCSLAGLSVGDAFGERFFDNPLAAALIARREAPAGVRSYIGEAILESVWPYTDDTQMALSIVACLEHNGEIDQDWLAADFARCYHPLRGYGPAMHTYLPLVREGADWQTLAGQLFGGQGSFGNGAAMRVAPLGGFFANELDRVIEQAHLSAEVTHAHPEGIAGAIAIAVAAALAWRLRAADPHPLGSEFLQMILPFVPESIVKHNIQLAASLPASISVRIAASLLGNGSRVSAQDTVPYTLWCAAQHLKDYEAALWLTLSGGGDIDTTCAIVGGIVALSTGVEGIPQLWMQMREPLPDHAEAA
jgi:ADP-ribosylglycohydrolase